MPTSSSRSPASVLGGAAQQPPGRRVGEGDPPLEVEDDDPRGRHREDAGEQALLLLVPRALLAQLVRHAVVDADQPVHLGLAHVPEAGGEVALREEARGLFERLEPAAQAAQEREAKEERDREHGLDRQEPHPAAAQQEERHPGEERVEEEEVGEEAGGEAHASIPCFSRRR